MSAPSREPVAARILDNVKTTLQGISTSSLTASYYTNVVAGGVHVMDKSPLENLETPCVAVLYQNTTHEFGNAGLHDSVMNLEVYCVMGGIDDATWLRNAHRFAADARKALMIDQGRGFSVDRANAFDTLIHSTVIANKVNGTNTSMAQLLVQIQFREFIDDPTTSA